MAEGLERFSGWNVESTEGFGLGGPQNSSCTAPGTLPLCQGPLPLCQGPLPLCQLLPAPVSSLALGTARDPGAAPAALAIPAQPLPTLPGNNSQLPRSHPALPSGTGSHSLAPVPPSLSPVPLQLSWSPFRPCRGSQLSLEPSPLQGSTPSSPSLAPEGLQPCSSSGGSSGLSPAAPGAAELGGPGSNCIPVSHLSLPCVGVQPFPVCCHSIPVSQIPLQLSGGVRSCPWAGAAAGSSARVPVTQFCTEQAPRSCQPGWGHRSDTGSHPGLRLCPLLVSPISVPLVSLGLCPSACVPVCPPACVPVSRCDCPCVTQALSLCVPVPAGSVLLPVCCGCVPVPVAASPPCPSMSLQGHWPCLVPPRWCHL
ncbi:keratin-associated protein 10-4-like [Serinus canaria]|uniref:keratin-associated protein 10-4-like n=1 Tax=Serinus canaria TaxID=9135 RepID=UPI0021CC60B1|nr:keratin-associated protein 10-4-like [Serinus canaria]